MNLRQQKQAVKAFAVVAGIGLGVWGISRAFSGNDNDTKTQTAVETTQTTPAPVSQTPAPVPAPVQQQAQAPVSVPQAAPQKRGDTPEEKQRKLEALLSADRVYLGQLGYNVVRHKDTGYCTQDGGVDGSGWHGVGSGLSYEVTKAGQPATVCVPHRGGKPQSVTGGAVQVQSAPVTAPATQQATPARVGDTASDKERKLAAMLDEDRAALGSRGFTLGRRLGFGYCKEDGSVDDSGWHGVSSGISYEATKNGRSVVICVEHKGGKPKSVKGSIM